MRFTDRRVLITGATGGIGRALVRAFAEEGARIAVHCMNDLAGAEELVEDVVATGKDAFAIRADVSDFNQSRTLVEKTVERFGGLDILVNNAGITRDQLMLRMGEEAFDEVVAVNLKGTWNLCKHVARGMLKQKYGRIVNIGSVVGFTGNAGQANYAATKAGIIGLTKALAKEFAKKNVTVNAVAPGLIRTPMTDALSEEIVTSYLSQIPVGRFGRPEEVAAAATFLASEAAAYITGETLHVNGGML